MTFSMRRYVSLFGDFLDSTGLLFTIEVKMSRRHVCDHQDEETIYFDISVSLMSDLGPDEDRHRTTIINPDGRGR